ncbi:MAG: molybdopterin molybdotransferase MoeA [Rhodospirillales bacterium]|nr:molybdopterin molybdotransferase MoeA [Rhodospirillales bacterium]
MSAISAHAGGGRASLDFEQALERVLVLAGSVLEAERVAAEACPGRVLASPICARLDLPGFDQSAMDGYAVRTAELVPGRSMAITGRTAAGDPRGSLVPGGVHRILTGAPLPQGADAVIAQERAQRVGQEVVFAIAPPAGTNLRRRGEDVRAGQRLMSPGTLLDWRHAAMLAAQGIDEASVRRRPRVALLSGGHELRGTDESLAESQIHDSNLPMLAALLGAWGAAPRRLPRVEDRVEALREALREAAADADLVVTTAGLSVGEEDHVRRALEDLGGSLEVLTVAMKPGKPLAVGRLGTSLFVGLPGNPQAALAGAVAFLRPLLARLTGAAMPVPLRARSSFTLVRKAGRTEFVAVRLVQRGAELWAERAGPEGSGRLAPLLGAGGLARLEAPVAALRAGEMLDVLPFQPIPVAP